MLISTWGFHVGDSVVKKSPANAEDTGLIDPWVRKILWRRKRQPIPVFFPGKSHGQKSLADYSPWDCRDRHDLVTKQQQFHIVLFYKSCFTLYYLQAACNLPK